LPEWSPGSFAPPPASTQVRWRTPSRYLTLLSERSACQQHLLDLCELLNLPKPAEVDPKGQWYTFEKGVETTEGGKGFADVWQQGKFGWEYMGKHKDLKAAYQHRRQRQGRPARLSRLLKSLFDSMARGEPYGPEDILHFNGGLFADSDTVDLTRDEINELKDAALCDWSSVEPTIFGTLFERTLDPSKRAQIGAHFTSREDIETVLRPVLLEPLRREWAATRTKADVLWEKVQSETKKAGKRRGDTKARKDFERCLEESLDRLAHVTVLDPACGSGNFLYVAITLLLGLEKEVLTYAADHGFARFPMVRPTQLRGLEINPYAHQLAQIVIWIGYLQWMYFRENKSVRNRKTKSTAWW